MPSVMGHQVAEGPARWERARRNAEAHPSSAGAKLYRARVAAAKHVEEALPGQYRRRAVTFVSYNEAFNRDNPEEQRTRRYSVCGAYCAALQLQLWFKPMKHLRTRPEASVANMYDWLSTPGVLERRIVERQGYGLQLRFGPVLTKSRCQCCGTTLLPEGAQDKAAVDSIAAATVAAEAKGKWFITPDGKMFSAAELRVVELTDDESVILSEYSTDELRAVFAKDFGYPLAES